MTIKVSSGPENGYIVLPQRILRQLGWHVGDEIEIDIPMTGGELTLNRKIDHFKSKKETT